MLPLLEPGSSATSYPASLFAHWSQYGVTLEAAPIMLGPLLVPCLQYRVEPQDTGQARTGRISNQVLQLFILLFEHASVGGGARGLDAMAQWTHCTNLTSILRRNLLALMSIHSEGVHKAVHSVLDKLMCNYASLAQVRVGRGRGHRVSN